MLYITTVMCLFYLGGKGYLDGTTFLGQTLTASTIVSFYMYIAAFLQPHSEPCGAVQLASIRICFRRKGVYDYGH